MRPRKNLKKVHTERMYEKEKDMKLLNRNFTLVVIGQIISLFGNAILRFTLPLYLLDQTGSSTVFGVVMAFSFIPIVLLSPIGGLLADRVNKRNIMVILDFSTALIAIFFLVAAGKISTTLLVTVVLIFLSGIQSVYQPAVQASMPVLQEASNLMTANAIINQVNSLAGLLGPILGGIVYGMWGVIPVVVVGGVCFFLSAVMEIFIHIPHTKRATNGSIFAIAKSDFSESMIFINREQPIIKKAVFLVAGFNLVLSSMLIIGVPVLIRTNLQMSSQQLGYTQAAQAVGALLGGVLAGVLGQRLRIKNAWLILTGTTLAIFPMGAALAANVKPMVSYLVITVCVALVMMFATMFTVQMMVFIQAETPGALVGKVISLAIAAASCAQPIGQAAYGVLFDQFAGRPHWIIFAAGIISVLITGASKKIFQSLAEKAEKF